MDDWVHPDPNKLWRLIEAKKAGLPWSNEDYREFRVLIRDWIAHFKALGNQRQVELMTQIRYQYFEKEEACRKNPKSRRIVVPSARRFPRVLPET